MPLASTSQRWAWALQIGASCSVLESTLATCPKNRDHLIAPIRILRWELDFGVLRGIRTEPPGALSLPGIFPQSS